MAQHEGRLPSRDEMAQACHISARTFNRRLSDQGLCYQALVDEERIKRARLLLEYDTLSITDIAHALHFSDASYFTKLFKSHTGQTPRAYKKSRA